MKDECVWRYMSLAKYIDVLTTGALFLPKAALLNDETEGKWIARAILLGEKSRWQKANNNAKKILVALETAKSSPDQILLESSRLYQTLSDVDKNSVLGEVLSDVTRVYSDKREEYLRSCVQGWIRNHDNFNATVQQWKTSLAIHRESTYISCWNRADSMSLAMWSLYGGGTESVVVRTTVKKLDRWLQRQATWLKERALTGGVYPISYLTGLQNPDKTLVDDLLGRLTDAEDTTVAQFCIKPDLYAYEQEVRVLVYPIRRITDPVIDPHPDVDGFAMPIRESDSKANREEHLFEAVHLHPMLGPDSMMNRVVRELHTQFGLSSIPIFTDRVEALGSGISLPASKHLARE